MRNFLFQKINGKNELGILFRDLFLFFKRASNEVKASDLELSFSILRGPSTLRTIKTKCEICSILIF